MSAFLLKTMLKPLCVIVVVDKSRIQNRGNVTTASDNVYKWQL